MALRFNHREGEHNGALVANWEDLRGWEPMAVRSEDETEPILRNAFRDYIENNPITFNTLGIEVLYLENSTSRTPKSIFIVKRSYDGNSENIEIKRDTTNYLNNNDLTSGVILNQERHEEQRVFTMLRSKVIIQIILCEIYNDSPNLRDYESYYPFTIPIKILYRKVPEHLRPQPTVQLRGGSLRLRDIPVAPRETQEDRRAQRESLEAQQALLENWPVEITSSVMGNYEDENPNPLMYVNDQILLNKEMSSYVWPGMCQICFTDDREGLCRVNCKVGHIFHCDCVNQWRNTHMTNTYYEHGWHNDCPVCHEKIESMVMVTPKVASSLPTSFGKKRKTNLKQIEMEIKKINVILSYLQKLK